ncbi:MAG: hypothetical protein D6732_11055 [Methanobacteriota archaeon]|nr:MAG: hypothetical protein D6732_11055 [Euryarchaeota archaeon]
MLTSIESKMLEHNARAVKYVKVRAFKEVHGALKAINEQINRDFGLSGPLALSIPSHRVHAVRWAMAREAFVVETHVKRVSKEIVAAAIAQINQCPYCEEVHGTSISSSGDRQTAKAIARGNWQWLGDEKTKAILEWSLNTRNPTAEIIRNPPFSFQEAPEIIGTALVFHSTNRLVSIFLEDSPLPRFLAKSWAKKLALFIASKTLFRSMVTKKASAGDALKFIEKYPAPKNLSWAQSIPPYVQALAAQEVLLTKIEAQVIPDRTAQLFKDFVNRWQGEDMPLGRAWLSELLSGLDEIETPAATLIFLAALAPYAITENDISNFRKINPTDKALIEVCFWAVETVTKRISEWLTKPFWH